LGAGSCGASRRRPRRYAFGDREVADLAQPGQRDIQGRRATEHRRGEERQTELRESLVHRDLGQQGLVVALPPRNTVAGEYFALGVSQHVAVGCVWRVRSGVQA
jgi:hypothetical protein